MKKKSQRLVALVLVICLLCTVAPFRSYAEQTDNQPNSGLGLTSLVQEQDWPKRKERAAIVPQDGFDVVPQSQTGINRYSVLLLDMEGGFSMSVNGETIYQVQTPLETVKQAAQKFVEQMQNADGTNHVAIVTYDSSAYVECGFTTNADTLANVISDIYVGSGFANINAALETADALLAEVTDPNAIKNVVLFNQGVTGAGSYSYSGPYTEEDCNWYITNTGVYIYEHSNAAYNTAQAMMKNYNLYSVGLFQEFNQLPEEGQSLLTFAKRFSSDLQNKGFYDVKNVDDLVFAFGDIANEIAVQEVEFQFSGVLVEDDVTSLCYYSDGYFMEDARDYNEHLATMSLCFELTTWSRYDKNAKWTTDETVTNTKYSNARDLLVGKLGFKDFMVNKFWSARPTKDSIGAVAAHKELPDGSLLIALGVRGGGYEQEWASNFTVGKTGEHDGFSEAKTNVLNFLDEYIRTYSITGPVKLWIVGYSRAGATANMVAGEIINGYDLENNVTIANEDLFAYTFEAAQGALKSNMKKDYSSIHNVLNINDVVPLVAPNSWGFGRYNIDEWLPSTYTDGYSAQKKVMLGIYENFRDNIPNAGDWVDSEYTIDDYGKEYSIKVDPIKFLPGGDPLFSIETKKIPTRTLMLDSTKFLFNDVIGGRETYYYDLQAGFRLAFALMNGGNLTDLLDDGITMDEFLTKFFQEFTVERILDIVKPIFALNFNSLNKRKEQVKENLEDFIKDVLNDSDLWGTVAFVADLGDTLTDLLWRLLESVVEDAWENGTGSVQATANLIAMAVGGSIGQAHYPEITLSWLMSQDSYYVDPEERSKIRGYRVIHINCPVDVYVYDEDTGYAVASIVDDIPDMQEDTSVDAYINANGEKMIILPGDAGYKIEMIATGEGTVSYTIDEFSLDRMDNSRIIHYDSIPVSTGDLLTGIVPSFSEEELESSIENGSNTVYTLLDDDMVQITPDQEVIGSDAVAAEYRVNLSSNNQNGYVTGGGTFSMGSFAQINAYPLPGCSFLGWYSNGVKVSDEVEYRFAVQKDENLVAHFGDITKYSATFTSETGGTVTNVDLTVPAQSQLILEAVADYGYEFDHWVSTGGSFVDIYDPNTTFEMPAGNVVITAKWRAKPEPVNPFTDVSANDYYYESVLWAVKNGITSGITPTTFAPFDLCLRSQAVTFLWRAAGKPEPTATENPFVDVKPTDYYYTAVLWAVENGITYGIDNTHFDPNGGCNRSQVVAFLYRAFGNPPVSSANTPFSDVPANEWYSAAVQWAVANNITHGVSDTSFAPNEACNRSQIVSFLYRAYVTE